MNDRVASGSSLLYYLRLGSAAQSGQHSWLFLEWDDAQSGHLRRCQIINFMHVMRPTRRTDVPLQH